MKTVQNIIICAIVASGFSIARADDAALELAETRTALQTALEKVRSLETEVTTLSQKEATLGESLAAANAESKQYRESYSAIRLQMEALGIDVVKGGTSALEQRLLKAVSDLRISEQQREKVTEASMKLAETVVTFLQTATEEGRDAVEKELRLLNELVGNGDLSGGRGSLVNARVISVKQDYGMVVCNVGKQNGIRVGMPLNIMRKERPIGSAMVFDVRDHVCGVVVQSLVDGNDSLQVGDKVHVEPNTQKNF